MYSEHRNYIIAVNQFKGLCMKYNIPVPKFEYSERNEETDYNIVKMTKDADPCHVFSHYLADLHGLYPDLVADIIVGLLDE